jgi:hypothetical protein
MPFGTDINSGRIRVDQRQASERGSFTGFISFLRIAYDCFNKWGGLTPGSGISLLNSPTGSSLPNTQAATKQITAKATGTMLV